MGLTKLPQFLKLLNRKLFIFLLLFSFIAGALVYHKGKTLYLEKRILTLQTQLKDEKNKLRLERENRETLLKVLSSKDKVIKQLQQNLKDNQNLCRKLLKNKDRLISDLQKIKATEPKDIKPKTIVKKNCKIKIETREALNEKDFVFDVLSNIGK